MDDKMGLKTAVKSIVLGQTKDGQEENKNYSNVVIGAIRLLEGKPSKSAKAFHINEGTWTAFQETLADCEKVWQNFQQARNQYDQAQKVLKAYYSRNQIFDFLEMLACFLKEEPRGGMDPEIYAEKGYFNYITYLRSMFGKLQERYQECPDFQSQRPAGSRAGRPILERRISLLREVGQSSTGLGALADTLEPYIVKDPDECADFDTAYLLSTIIEKNNLEKYRSYLEDKKNQMKDRIGWMKADVAKSGSLYERLCELLGTEERKELLDKLNPDNGMLKGKTVQEIRECYQPLRQPVREILERFPKEEP